MVTIWCAAVIEESGSVLVSFLLLLFCFNFFLAANLTLKGAIFTEQRNRSYSHRKWHSDDEILTEKQSLVGEKETTNPNTTPPPLPTRSAFEEVN